MEEQITKFKLVKQQMYGRAKIDLFQARRTGCSMRPSIVIEIASEPLLDAKRNPAKHSKASHRQLQGLDFLKNAMKVQVRRCAHGSIIVYEGQPVKSITYKMAGKKVAG